MAKTLLTTIYQQPDTISVQSIPNTYVRLMENSLTLVCVNLSTWLFSAGILINIECKAWARNIVHDRQERVGMVHFELMID
jgi:hypothetical protein